MTLDALALDSLSARLSVEKLSVDEACAVVRAMPIQSQADLDHLDASIPEVRAIQKRLDADRKALVSEPDGYVRNVNEIYRAPLRAYAALEQAVKDRIGRHVREQADAARQLQERAGAQFQAGAIQQAHASLAAAPAPVQPSSVYVREHWDAEITDPSQLPGEFWIPDLAAVRARVAATNGASIPGVRVFKSQTVVAKGRT